MHRFVLATLDRGRPASISAVVDHLATTRDPATLRGLCSALAGAPRRPPADFAIVLLDRLDELSSRGDVEVAVLAEALGRSLDQETAPRAIKVATGWFTGEPQQRAVIGALGRYHDRSSADTLIGLIGGDHSAAVRQAAFASLQHMTGRWDLGENAETWRAWHTSRRSLSASAWSQQLIENLQNADRQHTAPPRDRIKPARGARQATSEQLAQALADLVEARRKLYRASGTKDQMLMLTDWLGDGREPIRLLALELAEQRESSHEVGAPFRNVLRLLIDDRSPQIRRRTALLLYTLNDSPAADKVVGRLPHESEAEVLKAYLLLLSRLPRTGAIGPALDMMDDGNLRAPASAMLAAAIEQNLLAPDRIEQVAVRVREQLDRTDNGLPEPELVRLLARVATRDDWHRIEGWLDAGDEKVKDAAARAWAASDQPVLVLARRAGDDHIRQIAITAARQRGSDGPTMMTLIGHLPTDEQVRTAWRRALGEMAKHVPVETIVAADRRLGLYEGTAELREQLLTRGVGRLIENSGSNANGPSLASPQPLPRPEARLLIDLLTSRAELLLDRGEPRSALTDLQHVEKEQFHFDTGRQRRFRQALLRARLSADDGDQAFRVAAALLRDQIGGADEDALRDGIGEKFLEASERHLGADQPDRAAALLKALRRLLDARITERLNDRIMDLEARIPEPATNESTAPLPPDGGTGEGTATGS